MVAIYILDWLSWHKNYNELRIFHFSFIIYSSLSFSWSMWQALGDHAPPLHKQHSWQKTWGYVEIMKKKPTLPSLIIDFIGSWSYYKLHDWSCKSMFLYFFVNWTFRQSRLITAFINLQQDVHLLQSSFPDSKKRRVFQINRHYYGFRLIHSDYLPLIMGLLINSQR